MEEKKANSRDQLELGGMTDLVDPVPHTVDITQLSLY
jgi:hypothetical protein